MINCVQSNLPWRPPVLNDPLFFVTEICPLNALSSLFAYFLVYFTADPEQPATVWDGPENGATIVSSGDTTSCTGCGIAPTGQRGVQTYTTVCPRLCRGVGSKSQSINSHHSNPDSGQSISCLDNAFFRMTWTTIGSLVILLYVYTVLSWACDIWCNITFM